MCATRIAGRLRVAPVPDGSARLLFMRQLYPWLLPRHRTVLQQTVNGRSRQQIAVSMGIGPEMVDRLLAEALAILSARWRDSPSERFS